MESRVIKITPAAEKHGNLNISPCRKEFFPADVFGGSARSKRIGIPITLQVAGLGLTIKTDIPTDRITGRPRWIFRERAWVKNFVRTNGLHPGDTIVIERRGDRFYSISPSNGKTSKHTKPNSEIDLESYGIPMLVNDKAAAITKNMWLQHSLVENAPYVDPSDYGTFKDSLNAPVHRWFKYPAGYSYRLVQQKIRQYGLNNKHIILDPFVGSGTTCVEAKRCNINSVGIEAHPFVHWVAATKITWERDLLEIACGYKEAVEKAKTLLVQRKVNVDELPELVHKCYSRTNLSSLLAIRDAIRNIKSSKNSIDLLNLALTDTLRNASKAATGWPYISPAKIHQKNKEKEAFGEFGLQVRRMLDDLRFMQTYYRNKVSTQIILGDARKEHATIRPRSVDLVITSPPYINNYDYADRTRLETYFFGWYRTWGEISEHVRDKLITSATTQVRRNGSVNRTLLNSEIRNADTDFYDELCTKIREMSSQRQKKCGKKSYDVMVAGYFNDMFEVVKQIYRYLKPGADFVLVLGDSAPYGVYIPTHEYLARLGIGIGFSSHRIEHLRTRGNKWRDNPQRHKVKLNEVILTLTK